MGSERSLNNILFFKKRGVFTLLGGGDALTLLYELVELFKVSLFISHGIFLILFNFLRKIIN